MSHTCHPLPMAKGCRSHLIPTKYAYGRYYEAAPCDNYFGTLKHLCYQAPPVPWGPGRAPGFCNPDVRLVDAEVGCQLQIPVMPVSSFVSDNCSRAEVDDFYRAAQLFRDQYKDHTGSVHPLDYFKDTEYIWQCPPGMTQTYIKQPVCYPMYKRPPVLALAVKHMEECPAIANLSLAGRYSRGSEVSRLY